MLKYIDNLITMGVQVNALFVSILHTMRHCVSGLEFVGCPFNKRAV